MKNEFKLGTDVNIFRYTNKDEINIMHGIIISTSNNNLSYHGEPINTYKVLGDNGKIYFGSNDDSYINYDYCFKTEDKVKVLKK